jgi:cell division septum initiation protein DivIVA
MRLIGMSLAGILTGLLLLPTMAAADDIEDKLQQMQERMEQLEQKLDAQDEQLSAAQERVKARWPAPTIRLTRSRRVVPRALARRAPETPTAA